MKETGAPATAQQPCVLIIDDEPHVADVTRFLFRRSGFDAFTAYTPEEGLHLAFDLKPDVIVCDAAMPRLSGLQVTRILKSDPATEHIPVIMMSGHEVMDRPGIFTFVSKPFDAASLIGAARDALEITK
jgi:two-component system phosphate regulon response regulator PhoB